MPDFFRLAVCLLASAVGVLLAFALPVWLMWGLWTAPVEDCWPYPVGLGLYMLVIWSADLARNGHGH